MVVRSLDVPHFGFCWIHPRGLLNVFFFPLFFLWTGSLLQGHSRVGFFWQGSRIGGAGDRLAHPWGGTSSLAACSLSLFRIVVEYTWHQIYHLNHIKVYNLVAFSTTRCCATVTTIQFQNFPITPKETSCPWNSPSLALSPWQPLICGFPYFG